MKLTRADRRLAAIAMTAGAVMFLLFAQRRAGMSAVPQLPWEPPAAAQAAGMDLVDINTAGLEELTALPGIGEARARAILDDREANGPYRYPEDLLRVRGVGEGVLSGILDQITTGGNGYAQNTGG